jgi:transcriptional regulator with XRE-family HTH domain
MARTLSAGQRAAIRAAIARRGELGMSQRDLAKASGVSERAIQNFEGGHSWPNAKNLGQLERLGLRWPVGYLLEYAEEHEAAGPQSTDRNPLQDVSSELVNRIRALIAEAEDHLVAGEPEKAEHPFRRAVSVSHQIASGGLVTWQEAYQLSRETGRKITIHWSRPMQLFISYKVDREYKSADQFLAKAGISEDAFHRVAAASPVASRADYQGVENALHLPKDTLTWVVQGDLDSLRSAGLDDEDLRFLEAELAPDVTPSPASGEGRTRASG